MLHSQKLMMICFLISLIVFSINLFYTEDKSLATNIKDCDWHGYFIGTESCLDNVPDLMAKLGGIDRTTGKRGE